MALDYTGASAGIFTRAGKFVKYVNSRLASATTTLPAELKAIADLFEAADLTNQISGLYADYDGFKANVTSERQRLAQYLDTILTDRDTVLSQITVANVTGGGITTVLPALHRQMVADAQTVNRSTVTIGAVVAAAGNVGNGTVITSKLLDGYTAPLAGAPIMTEYAGLNSELAVPSETMLLECTADGGRNGLADGQERFTWSGGVKDTKLGYKSEGSGVGPGLQAMGAATLPTNGGFETWSSNVPSGWTIATGTAGTHILQSSGAANAYRGSYSLNFHGDGVLAAPKLTQAIATGGMSSRRLYAVSVRVKASAAAGTGTLTVQFEGTGYAAAASEKVSIAGGSMPVAWTLYSFFIVTPAVIPTDWKITVTNGGTPGAGADVWVDDLFIVPGVYHGGVAAAVVPGSSRFAAGDRFTFTVGNDAAGVFQEAFRKNYGVQLPSSAGPTIADALAT
jgi:hypothetical protein